MIQRMFWKEWREGRIAWLAVAIAAIAPVVFGSGLSFSGRIEAFSPWTMLPAALAVRLGIGLYSKDSEQDSGDFLFSRPVDWRAVVAAKLVTGVAVAVAACVLAALAYVLFARPQYRAFIDGEQMAAGVGFLGLVMLLGFGAGFGASALAPGKGGSSMVFVTFWALTVFTVLLNTALRKQIGWPQQDAADSISAACWFAGGALAAGIVTRFGLTAGFRYRLKVYALCTGAAFLVLAAVESGYHMWAANNPPEPRLAGLDPDSKLSRDTFLSVSPDGRYGVIKVGNGPSLVGIEGGKVVPIKRLGGRLDVLTMRKGVRWTPYGRAYWVQDQSIYIADPASAAWWRVRMYKDASWLVPSPDGRYLVYSTGVSSNDQPLYFVDLRAARQLDGTVRSTSSAWWLDDDTVGYTDGAGKRSFVRVSALRRLPLPDPPMPIVPPER